MTKKPTAIKKSQDNPRQSWAADQIERRDIRTLKVASRNPRTHSAEQIEKLRKSLRKYGWTNPLLIRANGEIVAGHGRWTAAMLEFTKGRDDRFAELPCMVVPDWWTAEDVRAYVIADNKLAEDAGWDQDLLKLELKELGELDFDLTDTGFTLDEINGLEGMLGEKPGKDESAYSRKIQAPIYEPKGDKPEPSELYDSEKTNALINEIRGHKLPKDIAFFLEKAAERHTVFDFRRIADFYASSEPEVQRLMEKSALVIIDFNQAIENGFVKLTQRLGELAAKAEEDSGAS